MMNSRKVLPAICLIAMSWTAPVFGTADGPDYYAVADVAPDDTLNLRDGPSAQARKIGKIPHDARGLKNLGCKGLPSYTDWQKMTAHERAASRKKYWCRIIYQGMEGWVAGRFLREDSAPTQEQGR